MRLENLSKSYWIRGRRKVVIDRLDLELPAGRSLALLGRNGAGKSTLLGIIAGTVAADTGRVIPDGRVSWPVGFGGSIHGQMTGAQNTRFVARIYGVDSAALEDFVRDFAELGEQFHAPVRTYSAGMKAKLGFGLSMGVPFDTYLIDEITAVGDRRFVEKSRAVFQDRMRHATRAIMVSHQVETLRQFCDAGAVLTGGRLEVFDDLEAAIERHRQVFGPGRAGAH